MNNTTACDRCKKVRPLPPVHVVKVDGQTVGKVCDPCASDLAALAPPPLPAGPS